MVLATTAMLSGCGTSSTGGATSPSASGAGLIGHTYVSSHARVGAAHSPLVAGSQLRLSFTAVGISASAGCNTMSGAGGVSGGTLVLTGPLSQTEMACSPGLMKQEQWWGDFLSSTPTVDVATHTITLAAGTGKVTMVDESTAVPDRPLEGTPWRLDGIVDGQTASSVPTGVTALVQFGGGTLDVAGCNNYRATYTITGDALSISPLHVTGDVHPCPTTGDALDQMLQKVLHGTVTYAIDGDRLTLSNGSAALTFQGMLRM